MSWDDDTFERDLLTYSEIETVSKEAKESVPQTIRRYQQIIQSNNNSSIFDADYSLSGEHSDSSLKENIHDDLLKDDKEVIKVVCGRGRGGRNQFHRPGNPNNMYNDDDDVIIEQIRKVAPIGYGNEITERAIRAHHQSKLLEKTGQASRVISNFSTPAKEQDKVVMEAENKSLSGSEKGRSPPYRTPSGESSPSSKLSDTESSDYFTSKDQAVSDDGQAVTGAERYKDNSKQQVRPTNQLVSSPKANSGRPIPMSEMLRRSREQCKQRHLQRQMNQALENPADELATRRKIQEILNQDRIEDEKRKKRLLERSPSSSTTSGSSREDILPWRRRTNSPPRYTWGQTNRETLNINSSLDFPPLN